MPPRAQGGGNIDCRELVAGATLFLPVTVPGALLRVGDGHAAQGDGEVSGTAIECGMTSRLTLDLVPEPPVPGVHAVTPAGRITFGFSEDLNEATAQALEAMVGWMTSLFGAGHAGRAGPGERGGEPAGDAGGQSALGVHALLPERAVR